MSYDYPVEEAIVSSDGRTYIAPFFVEAGIIHASIEATVVQIPLNDQPPEQRVAAVLLGHVEEQRDQQRWPCLGNWMRPPTFRSRIDHSTCAKGTASVSRP